MSSIESIVIDGIRYRLIPIDEDPVEMDAIAFARKKLGENLRAAREKAGLTQEQLASKLGKSQTLIARAENGAVHVGEKYVADVLKACGLPKTWDGK